jgi:3-hydroxybutyryl-CoA dehydratase
MNHYRFADLTLGMKRSFAAGVTAEMLDVFRALSGDINPLHADAAYAATRGYRDKVVFGMLTAAFYSTLVGVHLPGEHAFLHSVEASFLAPVFPGDRLEITGEITHLQDAYRQAEIKATISGPDGHLVSRAKLKVGLDV